MHLRWWRVLLLALLAACGACSGGGDSKHANTVDAQTHEIKEATDTKGAPTVPPKVQVKDIGALVDLIVAGAGDLPRAEFDPAALATSLGNDPQKIFEWVRDRTWWAPYRGLLRGAKGVMLDRLGSNLDRAVLLGDLLCQAGHKVRLAHALLPEARARELLAKVRPIPDQRRGPIARGPVAAERQKAIEAIIPGINETIETQIARSKRRTEEGKSLVRSQVDQLLTTVRDVANPKANDEKGAIAALQDHWWVEREDDGKWIAMDVLLPDASISNTLATASTTSEWKTGADTPSIPDEDWHTVQIRVIVERYEDGATTESTALETLLRPAEVLERKIILGHMPRPWPDTMPDIQADPNALKNAALWANEWVPVLQVGDDVIVQSAFTEGGDLTPASTDSAAGLGRSSGTAFSDFGSALGGGEEAGSNATAEWIDYEVRVPGQSSQRLRRTVFDLLGPAKRSAKTAGFDANTDALKLERFEALWGRTDILLLPCDFTSEFVAHLATAGIISNRAALEELSQENDPAKAKELASEILDRVGSSGPLPELALWRTAISSQPDDRIIERPNILNYRITESFVKPDRATLRELIDIVTNPVGVRLAASKSSFEVRLAA